MDSARGHLYVCGGRVNDWTSEVPKFSGLYCYDVAKKAWSQLPCAIVSSLAGLSLMRCGTDSRVHRLRYARSHTDLVCSHVRVLDLG
jgi:Kelch motif